MTNRRKFLQAGAAVALSMALPTSGFAMEQTRVSTRRIPGTDEKLPVIGLGNSNAFREGDVELSKQIIELLLSRGGSYIDCGGSSRFTVGQIAGELHSGRSLFLGTYFSDDEQTDRADADRILALTGRQQLDLMHSYPEHAEPNWDKFRQFKDEGLTRYILDGQTFDLEGVRSIADDPRHVATSPFTSYNDHGKGNFASMVDVAVLGGAEQIRGPPRWPVHQYPGSRNTSEHFGIIRVHLGFAGAKPFPMFGSPLRHVVAHELRLTRLVGLSRRSQRHKQEPRCH